MAADLRAGPFPPHMRERTGIGFAWIVVLCLLPAGAWGTFAFGTEALRVLAVSVGSACLVELLLSAPGRRFTLPDGTAFLTGLLIGYCMPPGIALYVPAAACAFAVAVVKLSFGGLGRNWMNPAMAGRTFALLCWPATASSWTAPFARVDATGSATPLSLLRGLPAGARPWDAMASLGLAGSGVDARVTDWLHGALGIALPHGSVDLLIGWRSGAIGEVSILLLAAGAAVLAARRIIRWEIPVSLLAAFALLSWVFGGPAGTLLEGAPFHAVCSGGVVLCAFFCATDPVTSPMSRLGRVLFAAGAGCLAFLFRRFGSQPEGVGAAVLLMNCLVPLLDRWMRARPFGASGRAAV